LQGYLFAKPMPFDDFMERYGRRTTGKILRLRREGHVIDG